MENGPRSKYLFSEEVGGFRLTHVEWNSMPEYSSQGSNETGIRRLQECKAIPGSFDIIQHGWRDWQRAGEIIKRLLIKGKSPNQIAHLMDFIKERGRINQPPRAIAL